MCCDESYICMCVCLSVCLSSVVCRPGLVMMPSDDVDDDDDDGLTHTWNVPLGLLAMNKCSICSFECNMLLMLSQDDTHKSRSALSITYWQTIQRRLARAFCTYLGLVTMIVSSICSFHCHRHYPFNLRVMSTSDRRHFKNKSERVLCRKQNSQAIVRHC